MLRAEVDRVVGDDLIARGVGGVDRIALEHVVAVVLDRSRSHLGRVGHASPPLGLRGARGLAGAFRSEEHTSELQSLMRISYAVFCLKKKKNKYRHDNKQPTTTTNNEEKAT